MIFLLINLIVIQIFNENYYFKDVVTLNNKIVPTIDSGA